MAKRSVEIVPMNAAQVDELFTIVDFQDAVLDHGPEWIADPVLREAWVETRAATKLARAAEKKFRSALGEAYDRLTPEERNA